MHSVRVCALFGHLPVPLELLLFLCSLFRVQDCKFFLQVLSNPFMDLSHWCLNDFELRCRQFLRECQVLPRGDDHSFKLADLCVEILHVKAITLFLTSVFLTAEAVFVIDVVLRDLHLRNFLFFRAALAALM